MNKSIFTFLFFITSHCASIAQANAPDSLSYKLDEYLLSANKINKFNGAAVIAQHGKIILEKAYGKKTLQAMF